MDFRQLQSTLLAVAMTACGASGCTKNHLSDVRGPGFNDQAKNLTADIPQRENAGKPYSFSTKAREIEQNFGFE